MDIKLIAAYEQVIADLTPSAGWESKMLRDALVVLATRKMELENWELYAQLDEVPD
jgi:hypothetical protein